MPHSTKTTHFNMTPDLMRLRVGDNKAKWIEAYKKSDTPCCCLTDRTEGQWKIVSICGEFLGVLTVRLGITFVWFSNLILLNKHALFCKPE